jgi:hypothetical protein
MELPHRISFAGPQFSEFCRYSVTPQTDRSNTPSKHNRKSQYSIAAVPSDHGSVRTLRVSIAALYRLHPTGSPQPLKRASRAGVGGCGPLILSISRTQVRSRPMRKSRPTDTRRPPNPIPSSRPHRGRSRSCPAIWARDGSRHAFA